MSLIDEALKKVSEEAARRDALTQGVPLPYAAAPGAERHRFRRGFGIGIGAGLLLVMATAVLVFVRPAVRHARSANVSNPSAANSVPPPVTEEVVVPPPAGPAPAAVRAPAPPIRHPSRPKAPPVPKTPGIPANGGSYPAKLELPDGQAIELDGIVYSDTKPVALVNGRVLTAGDFVLDFRVVKIERDHLTLEGRGATFTMTMH